LRWRIEERAIDQLPARQLAILDEARQWVRPGGRLVYATCSPLREENEAVVDAFLERSREFRRGDLRPALGPNIAEAAMEGGMLRLWPHRHGGGAFAAALLVRR
jgi:16S rRNA (cytosine967-C5)-methyltransferase